MTDKDKELLEKARRVDTEDYLVVHNMIMEADTNQCKAELRKIRDYLFEIRQ